MNIHTVSKGIMGQGNTNRYKQYALGMKWRMEGKTHLMELNSVLPVVYERTNAPGTGTWLFTMFVYGKSGMYERICWDDAVYERTNAPGTGTWLFTMFVYGKSGMYEHICWHDGRKVRTHVPPVRNIEHWKRDQYCPVTTHAYIRLQCNLLQQT